MNFEWIPEYRRADGWSDADFQRYGLSSDEILYANTITDISEGSFEWILRMFNEGEKVDFGIQETWVYVDGDSLSFSDNFSDTVYTCTKSQFLSDIMRWLRIDA